MTLFSLASKPRRTLVIWSLLGLLFAPAISTNAIAAPSDDLDVAISAFELKDYERAAKSFGKFLAAAEADDADLPLARFYLGYSLVRTKDFAGARKALNAYLTNHPKGKYTANARYQLGWASYLAGNHELAEKEFSTFLEKHETDQLAQYALAYLGDVQLQLDKPAAAAKTFGRSLEQHPKGVMAEDARMGLARALERTDRLRGAIEQYNVVSEDPRAKRRIEAQFRLGNAYFDLRKHAEAAVAYDRLVEQFPKSEYVPQALLNAGFAFYEAGWSKDAVERFESAAKYPSQATTARYWNGVTHEKLGEFAKASALFEQAYKSVGRGAEAPRILYRWGQSELARKEYASAETRLAELVTKFPDHELADDGLHFAAEAALGDGNVAKADEYVARFEKDHPGSPLKTATELLAGRIDLAANDPRRTRSAIKRFQAVLGTAQAAETKDLARYELVRARFREGDHAGVVRDVAPLAAVVAKDGAESRFVDALLLQSTSLLATKQYASASKAATAYLKWEPKGPQSPRAIANRARAEAALGNETPAKHNLTLLANLAPDSPLVAETTFDVAEIAYETEEFEWAAELYDRVAAVGAKSPYHARSLSGGGWASFELKRFDDAAKRFGSVVKDYANDPALGPEARFMTGESLKRDGELEDAADALVAAFDALAPESPAAKGSATGDGPLRYAFESGKEAARTRRKLKDIEAADELYRRVADLFPEVDHHDLLLDEWALLHYEAERYDAADAIWSRLVEAHPDSERADDARLQLAESANIAGRVDEAAKEFNSLAGDESADADVREIAREHLIEIAVGKGDWNGVRSAADDLLKEFPESRFAMRAAFRRGEALLMLDDHRSARMVLEPLLKQTGAPDRAWVLLAEAHFRDKEYARVDALVNELRAKQPKSPFLYQADEVLGRSLKQRARFADARKAFERVVTSPSGKKTETAAKAQLLLGDTFVQQTEKDYERAYESYLKVYASYDFPEWRAKGLFQAAACNAALGKTEAAKRAYEELLEKFPESDHVAEATRRLKTLN